LWITGRFGNEVLLARPRRGGPAPTEVLGRGRHRVATAPRRLWAAVPSAAQGDKVLLTSGSGGRGRDSRPWSWSRKSGGCGQGAPVDRPRAAVVPPPQLRGDRLPACRSPVDRSCVAERCCGLYLMPPFSAVQGDRPRLVTLRSIPGPTPICQTVHCFQRELPGVRWCCWVPGFSVG
jgi:hypothetical protein